MSPQQLKRTRKYGPCSRPDSPAIEPGTSNSAQTPLEMQGSLLPSCLQVRVSTVNSILTLPTPGLPLNHRLGGPKNNHVYLQNAYPLLLECITRRGVSQGLAHLRLQEHLEMWNMGGALPPHQTH